MISVCYHDKFLSWNYSYLIYFNFLVLLIFLSYIQPILLPKVTMALTVNRNRVRLNCDFLYLSYFFYVSSTKYKYLNFIKHFFQRMLPRV